MGISGILITDLEGVTVNAVVILAGGKSRRMGRDKLVLTVDGQTLLESAISRFAKEFTNVYLSVAEADKYPDSAAPSIVDILPGAGPISGLHAALTRLAVEGVFLVAADMPYACPLAAGKIIELCGEHDACLIRLPDGKLEPLFAYYRKSLLPRCVDIIKSGDYRMTELLLDADTRFISPGELGDLWNEKLIYNINYPKDYEFL